MKTKYFTATGSDCDCNECKSISPVISRSILWLAIFVIGAIVFAVNWYAAGK